MKEAYKQHLRRKLKNRGELLDMISQIKDLYSWVTRGFVIGGRYKHHKMIHKSGPGDYQM